jgi:hypothetical protein
MIEQLLAKREFQHLLKQYREESLSYKQEFQQKLYFTLRENKNKGLPNCSPRRNKYY